MNGLSVSGRSPGRSRKGSHAGSHAGSHVGSHVGSHAGSGFAGFAGSHMGSLGSYAGSHVGSSSGSHSPGPQRYVLLRQSLAITLRRTGSVPLSQRGLGASLGVLGAPDQHLPGPGPGGVLVENDFWMYDNGYLLFQGFVEANARCFWSAALLEAMRELSFEGYVSPGVLLVRAGACALDVVRAAWARRVLKPPPNYVLADVGDIEDCCVAAVPQSQFTPLPEALCWVILELTSTGQAAVLPAILRALPRAFPAMTRPEAAVVYDALAKLSTDRKVYQTARGYFLVTPETRRRLASMQQHSPSASSSPSRRGRRSMLLSNEEAIVMVHGDMQTERDGHRTHQCVQTNLADVICGGNPEDKVLYARDRSVESQGRALERRHSLRLSTRLGQALQRAGSLRSLPPRPPPTPPSTPSTPSPEKKQSLLSRLFRRSGRPRGSRGRRGQSAPPGHSSSREQHQQTPRSLSPGPQIKTFSAQFPLQDDDDGERHPADWFNPGVTALTSVATQTQSPTPSPSVHSSPARSSSSPAVSRWDSPSVGRASTLPRSLSRGSPRRARRLSDSLSVSLLSGGSVSRAASPASHVSHAPTTSSMPPVSPSPSPSPSLSPNKSPSKLQAARKTSPSNTLLSSASSRASGASRTSRASASTAGSGMSKASSGYNSSGTRSGSPTTTTTTTTTTPAKSLYMSQGSASSVLTAIPGSTVLGSRNTTTTTTTINGTNTKIYVQQHAQHNPSVRSVITIENRSGGPGGEHALLTRRGPVLETSFDRTVPPSSSASSASSPSYEVTSAAPPSSSAPTTPTLSSDAADRYSSNKINNHNLSGKPPSSSASASSEESLTSASSLVTKEAKDAEMNNSRKLSLPTPTGPGFLRESLSYKNILKEVQNYAGGPQPSLSGLSGLSASPYASLSDLSVHCKSLAAQRILSGVSINSIDTLVEVNMAAEKKTNCDVTIRTDFGMV